MATTEQIAIELRVRNQQLANDLKKSEREVKRLNNAFAELGNTSVRVERQVNSVARSTGLMATATKAFVGIAVAGFVLGAAKAFSQYASAVQGANNQLRAATNSQAEFQRLAAGTLQIANQTGTSFESVANSAARFNRAISTFGGTVDQALIVTDSFSKSLLISGASTNEATAALQQFGQALESGILAGDEFRSLRENAPVAARAIADSLDVSLGKLRELSEQGKLTTDQVAKALIDGNKKISEQAAQIPLTLDRALTVAGNAFKDFIAENEGLNELLATAGQVFIELSSLLVTIANDASGAGGAFEILGRAVITVANAVKIFIAILYTLGKAIKLSIDLSATFAFTFLRVVTTALRTVTESVQEFASSFIEALAAAFRGDAQGIKDAVGGFATRIGENLDSGLALIGESFRGGLSDIKKDLGEFGEGVGGVWDNIVNGVVSQPLTFDPGGELKKTAQELDGVDKAAKKLLDTYEKLLKALQDYQTSQLSLPDQAQAQFAELVTQVNAYRDAAKAAGKAVDEALVASVLASGVKERDKELADLEQRWRDIIPPVNEAEAASRRFFDEMRNIREVGESLGKTEEEIRAMQDTFAELVNSEEARRFKEYWVEVGKTVIDTFGAAFQSIVDGSQSAKDALRGLLEQLLILIAKAAILTALGGGSFLGNLGGAILGNGRSGGGGGGGGDARSFGFSSRNSGTTVRIYNQGGGLVSTQNRGNGDVDVMIGALATAVSRGGNNFDAVLRRTYGLGRVGV
jgi:tape measure domain-containing protein